MRIAAAWLLGALCWAAFVAFTSIGPVVYSLGWRHGVHATDILFGVLAAGLAGQYTRSRINASAARSEGRSRVVNQHERT